MRQAVEDVAVPDVAAQVADVARAIFAQMEMGGKLSIFYGSC